LNKYFMPFSVLKRRDIIIMKIKRKSGKNGKI